MWIKKPEQIKLYINLIKNKSIGCLTTYDYRRLITHAYGMPFWYCNTEVISNDDFAAAVASFESLCMSRNIPMHAPDSYAAYFE